MKKFVSASVAAAVALTSFAVAAPAQARNHGYDYNDNGYYDRNDRRQYRRDQRNYDRSYYNNGSYRGDRYYYNGQRCRKGSGTTGTIIGAIAGGLLGREVVGRRGDRTAGAIIGAGAGALAGRAIDRSGDRRC